MYKDEYKHTLYQALHVDFKDYCTLCNPMTEDEAMSRLAESKTE